MPKYRCKAVKCLHAIGYYQDVEKGDPIDRIEEIKTKIQKKQR